MAGEPRAVSGGSDDNSGRAKQVHVISVSMPDRSPENGALTFACPTGQVHAVIVSEAVAIRQAGQ